MIFGNERAYDTKSRDFSLRRIFVFIILVFLILANVILAKHAAMMKRHLTESQQSLQLCELKCKK